MTSKAFRSSVFVYATFYPRLGPMVARDGFACLSPARARALARSLLKNAERAEKWLKARKSR